MVTGRQNWSFHTDFATYQTYKSEADGLENVYECTALGMGETSGMSAAVATNRVYWSDLRVLV
jgi:hypothetical protein